MRIRALFLFSVLAFVAVSVSVVPLRASASAESGTIDSARRYAWSENAGWIDFGGTDSAVTVTDAGLSGYAYGETIGWISLSCANTSSCGTVDFKVANDGEGNLSGYAWAENAGWVDFDPDHGGVTISDDGAFSGYAWSETIGWVSFSCADTSSCNTVDFGVATDWRPASSRRSSSSGSVTGYMPTKNPDRADVSETDAGLLARWLVSAKGLFKKDKPPADSAAPVAPPEPVVIPEDPLVWKGAPLIAPPALAQFLFAPLPRDLSLVAARIPEISSLFAETGVSTVNDITKLVGVDIRLPRFGEITEEGGGTAALPENTIFARGLNEVIDLGITLSVAETGDVRQTLETVAGQEVTLVVRPEGDPLSVTGRVSLFPEAVFGAAGENAAENSRLRLAAFAFLAQATGQKSADENRRAVLDTFEYADQDGDGVWEARVAMPVVAGRYRVETVIVPEEGAVPETLELITVVDPEGYVYRRAGADEARIRNALVTLYQKDAAGAFAPWDAEAYFQENPQTTGKDGAYSFLVPEGTYYLAVEAAGYKPYRGAAFEVVRGRNVHENIELAKIGWLSRLFKKSR